MKSAFDIRRRISQLANLKLSKWTARSTWAQSSEELSVRGTAAVAEALIAVEDTQILIAESRILAARHKASRLGRISFVRTFVGDTKRVIA